MFAFTLSTPDRTNLFVTQRTHKNLLKKWGKAKDEHDLFWIVGGKSPRFLGTIIDGKLVKPA